jgi:pimeloyl-ACP methyl ester carboxylesterase
MTADRPDLVGRLIVYEPAAASFVNAPEDANSAAADRLAMTTPARARVRLGDTVAAVALFMDGVNDRPGAFDGLPHDVQRVMLENHRTLPLLFAAPPVALSCDDLKRIDATLVVVARGDATRGFYRIAAEWTAACVPGATLIVIPDARHLFPVEDAPRFTTLLLDLLAMPEH